MTALVAAASACFRRYVVWRIGDYLEPYCGLQKKLGDRRGHAL